MLYKPSTIMIWTKFRSTISDHCLQKTKDLKYSDDPIRSRTGPTSYFHQTRDLLDQEIERQPTCIAIVSNSFDRITIDNNLYQQTTEPISIHNEFFDQQQSTDQECDHTVQQNGLLDSILVYQQRCQNIEECPRTKFYIT